MVANNDLDRKEFREWLFCPQMLFGAVNKWWGRGGGRGNPHEGLDIGPYRDHGGCLQHMKETTGIPAVASGSVAGIIDDFLGKTIILYHAGRGNWDFLSLYGHTRPEDTLGIGHLVAAGETIATLNRPTDSNATVPVHLHLSLARYAGRLLVEEWDWKTIGSIPELFFIDPLPVIGDRYQIVDRKDLLEPDR